jgi:lipopolysaccharide transport system ATP-binding protein
MSDVVIRVENLSKHYRLGTIGGATLREDTQRWWAKLRGRPDPLAPLDGRGKSGGNDHWALSDVSFEVRQGEVLGIIGRNGAGKSTLLKILSRTTAPTKGKAMVKGRIGSLLEVGTGFHPELSGRENVYLNGSILGMRKSEIDSKLDEIIDFSGVERFIDTPVKRYSSGMYVRLAFAVAAHLEPEILIVDEVLAVGDASFQKKCVGKMENVAANGRTVLFVSHNIGIVGSLCHSAILLRAGRIAAEGSVSETAAHYFSSSSSSELRRNSGDLASHPNRSNRSKPYLRRISIVDSAGSVIEDISQKDALTIVVEYDANESVEDLAGCGFQITSAMGVRVGGFNNYMFSPPPHKIPKSGSIVFRLLGFRFTPGRYFVSPSLGTHQNHLVDEVEDALMFTVHAHDIYETGYILTPEDGVCAFNCHVEVNEH